MGFDSVMRDRWIMAGGGRSPLAVARASLADLEARADATEFALRSAMAAHPEAAGGLGVMAAAVARFREELRANVAGQCDRAILESILGS